MKQITNGSIAPCAPLTNQGKVMVRLARLRSVHTTVLALLTAFCMIALPIYADNNDSDEYVSAEDEAKAAEEAEESQAADEYTDADSGTSEKKKKSSSKGNPRKQGINKLFYGNGRYIEYDEFKLYTINPLGKLSLVKGTAIINPKNGDVGVKTRFQASTYAVLFDNQMMHKIFGAVDQYLKDFENKKLKRKDKKSYCVYGRGEAYINYGTLAIMMAAEGRPKVQIGYKFKGKSPYFAITVRSAPNIDPNKATNDVKDSTEVVLYFTKAQAQTMCSILRDEKVQEVLAQEMEESGTEAPENVGDEYTEE